MCNYGGKSHYAAGVIITLKARNKEPDKPDLQKAKDFLSEKFDNGEYDPKGYLLTKDNDILPVAYREGARLQSPSPT